MPQAHAEHSQAELGCREALLFTANMSAVLFSVNSQDFSSSFRSLFSFNKIMYLANKASLCTICNTKKAKRKHLVRSSQMLVLWLCPGGKRSELLFTTQGICCAQHSRECVLLDVQSFALLTLQSCKGIPSQARRACPGGGTALAKL